MQPWRPAWASQPGAPVSPSPVPGSTLRVLGTAPLGETLRVYLQDAVGVCFVAELKYHYFTPAP
eukprot:2021875-Alexandrium_andersonii.AAC.1